MSGLVRECLGREFPPDMLNNLLSVSTELDYSRFNSRLIYSLQWKHFIRMGCL